MVVRGGPSAPIGLRRILIFTCVLLIFSRSLCVLGYHPFRAELQADTTEVHTSTIWHLSKTSVFFDIFFVLYAPLISSFPGLIKSILISVVYPRQEDYVDRQLKAVVDSSDGSESSHMKSASYDLPQAVAHKRATFNTIATQNNNTSNFGVHRWGVYLLFGRITAREGIFFGR